MGSILLYWQRYCTALEQRSSSKFCGVVCGTRDEIEELLQRAPRIISWVSASATIEFHLILLTNST